MVWKLGWRFFFLFMLKIDLRVFPMLTSIHPITKLHSQPHNLVHVNQHALYQWVTFSAQEQECLHGAVIIIKPYYKIPGQELSSCYFLKVILLQKWQTHLLVWLTGERFSYHVVGQGFLDDSWWECCHLLSFQVLFNVPHGLQQAIHTFLNTLRLSNCLLQQGRPLSQATGKTLEAAEYGIWKIKSIRKKH